MVNGPNQQTGWIAENLAVVGKILKDEEDGNVWKVKTVYNVAMDAKEANERSRDYKKTRAASDI